MDRRSDIYCKHKELFILVGKCSNWEEACKIYVENINTNDHLSLPQKIETQEINEKHKTNDKCIIL